MSDLLFPSLERGQVSGPCHICGQELDPKHHAECQYCRHPFHLRMTEGEVSRDAKDCGLVWLDEENFSMVFACNACVDEQNVPPPLM